MRFGLSQAGVTGRLYLFKDDQLAHDIVQVRLDSFVGPRKVVSEGTMQGRRTAVRELNLLMVPQVEEVERLAGGTALTPPDEAVAAWARSPVDLAPEKQTFPKPLVQDLLNPLRQGRGVNWDHVMKSLRDEGAKQLALNQAATVSVVAFQYLDDGVVPAASMAQL